MAIKYIPYFPDPIDGQAILDNFARTLKYKGNLSVKDKVVRGMPLYDVETTEVVGSAPDNNMVIRGECLSACAYLKDHGTRIDLVYIDPPFASGADYAKTVYLRKNPAVAAALSSVDQELDIEEIKSFEEKMYGDIWTKESYLNWMYENLMAIKSVMSENATIYVHLDHHIVHYVKVLMDEIFGESNFRNEIIWKYSTSGAYVRNYARNNDHILVYSMNDDYIFNQDRIFDYVDYAKKVQEGKEIIDEEGILYYMYNGEKRTFEKQMTEVWTDIDKIKRDGNEINGYATQKPEALLSRIIRTSSTPGMLVADFFGGSGVTAAVANKLGRRFIHCDIGINSIQTSRDRLSADGAAFSVMEIQDGISLYRNPVQTMDKLKSIIPGLRNEASLGKFWAGAISDSTDGMVPVYIPNLLDSSTKLLDLPMINEIIHREIPDLPDNVSRVIVYYIDVVSIDEITKYISNADSTNVKIELRDLKDLLDDIIVSDIVDYSVSESESGLFTEYQITIDRFISDRVVQKISEYNAKQSAQALKSTKKKYSPIILADNGLDTIEFISLDCTNSEGPWHSDSEIKIDAKTSRLIVNGERRTNYWDGRILCKQKPLRMKIRNICGDETIIKLD